MKKSVVITVCIAISMLLLQAAGQVPQASIRFLATKHEFGMIPDDAGKVSHVFHFVNDGSAPLLITKVTTSCACTKTEFSKRPISPGDTATLVVTYNPKGQKGFFATPIQIYSNAPHQRDIVVVTGEVKQRKRQ